MEINWVDTIQSVGVIANLIILLVGFYFINKQVSQVNKANRTNTNNNLYSLNNDFLNFIADNNIRPYFYDNKVGENSEKESNLLQIACEKVCCIYEFVFIEKDNLDKKTFENWINAMTTMYLSSATMRNHISKSKEWYDESFIESIEKLNKKIITTGTEEDI